MWSIEKVAGVPWWGPQIGNFTKPSKVLVVAALTLLVSDSGQGVEQKRQVFIARSNKRIDAWNKIVNTN